MPVGSSEGRHGGASVAEETAAEATHRKGIPPCFRPAALELSQPTNELPQASSLGQAGSVHHGTDVR